MVIYAKDKKERSLGERLFLKAYRSKTPKSAMIRKPYPPGPHGKNRRGGSEFSNQLKAKQKIKLTYRVNEVQLKNIFLSSSKIHGGIGDKMIESLERRLDNTLFRAGIFDSRIMARQAVGHGHVLVNGKKTTSPGFQISVNDVISPRPESIEKALYRGREEILNSFMTPSYLRVDPKKLEITVLALPLQIEHTFNINAVVEYFSKVS